MRLEGVLLSGDSSALIEAIGGSIDRISAKEIASMVSASGAIAGSFPDKSPEEIAKMMSALTDSSGSLEGKTLDEIAALLSSGNLPELSQENIDALIPGSATAEEVPQQAQTQ